MKKIPFFKIACLLVGLFLFYACWIEPRSLVIKTTTLQIPGLKQPIKAVLIGDPQPMNPYWPPERMRWVMDTAQAQKPDIIFFVGDYAYEPIVWGQTRWNTFLNVNPADTISAMARIHAPMGCYAILGNHDWWWNGPEVIRLLKQTHIQLLRDQAILAQHKGQKLWVAGLEDMATPLPYD